MNIVTNAIDAIAEQWGESNDGRLEISSRFYDETIELRFKDNGVGIEKEIQRQLFDPFFSTKDVGAGTGQGLSYVYDVVVVKHTGSIQVNSQPGEGAEFILRLPVAKQMAEVAVL